MSIARDSTVVFATAWIHVCWRRKTALLGSCSQRQSTQGGPSFVWDLRCLYPQFCRASWCHWLWFWASSKNPPGPLCVANHCLVLAFSGCFGPLSDPTVLLVKKLISSSAHAGVYLSETSHQLGSSSGPCGLTHPTALTSKGQTGSDVWIRYLSPVFLAVYDRRPDPNYSLCSLLLSCSFRFLFSLFDWLTLQTSLALPRFWNDSKRVDSVKHSSH